MTGPLGKGPSFVEVSMSFDISLTCLHILQHLGRDKHMALKSPPDLIIRGSLARAAPAAPDYLGRL